MSNCAVVVVIVEGPTEQKFVKELLAPYLAPKGVYLTPVILNKPGEKGGDVRFARAKNDIGHHLKQRQDTWVTLLVDYYGIRSDWPGYDHSKQQTDHTHKFRIMSDATMQEVNSLFPRVNPEIRFIPYFSMHELEALYFSDTTLLAQKLGALQQTVDAIVHKCGEPEKVNDNKETAPSKRLAHLSDRFKKTSTGIAIAREIGIPKMRNACPLFNQWVTRLESLRS